MKNIIFIAMLFFVPGSQISAATIEHAGKLISVDSASEKPDKSKLPEMWDMVEAAVDKEIVEVVDMFQDEMKAALLPTGPSEAGWQSKGIDIEEYIASLPGGLRGNALLTNGEVTSIDFRGPIPAQLMDHWELIRKGANSKAPALANGGTFFALSSHHILFANDGELIRNENAICIAKSIDDISSQVQVYRDRRVAFDPEDELSAEAEAEAFLFYKILTSVGVPPICSVYTKIADDSIRIKTYTSRGRPLGKIDEGDEDAIIVQDVDFREQLTSKFKSPFSEEETEDPIER